uniref:endo-polygalacturonase n=1 Tax=Geotrichum citri-aurantii TaxID=58640 RepID=I0CL49_9ASCO|nr:polygalacturonase [Galactomyces citri-aurantii]
MLFSTPAIFAMAAIAVAAPTEGDLQARGGACVFRDAHSAIAGKKSCSSITLENIAVPAGQTLDLTGLAKGTVVTFAGTTTFGYKEWEGPLISVSGDSITVNQASGGKIDCGGSRWWDGKGSNSGGKTKPKFFAAHKLQNSNIQGLQVYNTPVQAFSILSDHLTLSNILIDNRAGDKPNGGHNTDAFDVGSSTFITIDHATVYNQDDCLAINSGDHIIFQNGFCSGGHGLSIGSVGGRSDNSVTNVQIINNQVVNSDNGVRIKSVSGTTGNISGVKFQDITLSNIAKYGIDVQQDYRNGGPTGNPTNGVKITGIEFINIHGSVKSSGTNAYILCGSGSCSNWTWSQINVRGGKDSGACKNVPAGATCSI